MNDLEHQIQKAAIEQLRLILPRYGNPVLASFPNGGYRPTRTGRKMREEGQRKGMPDLFLARSCEHTTCDTGGDTTDFWFNGLFIEVKSPKGRLRDSQKEVIGRLREDGYAVAICRSTQEIIDTVLMYLNGDFEQEDFKWMK